MKNDKRPPSRLCADQNRLEIMAADFTVGFGRTFFSSIVNSRGPNGGRHWCL